MNKKYSVEHIKYITDNIKGQSYSDLTAMFNKQFGMTLKISTMVSLASRLGFHNERDCRFNKGYEPTQLRRDMFLLIKVKKELAAGSLHIF
jgi:hypothetical protein